MEAQLEAQRGQETAAGQEQQEQQETQETQETQNTQEAALLAREHALLERFSKLPASLQEMILRHMYALERAEREARAALYGARSFGYRFTGFASEGATNALRANIEEWWQARNRPATLAEYGQALRAALRPSEECVERSLGAVVAEFTSGAGVGSCGRGVAAGGAGDEGDDELNLSAAEWRAVLEALRIEGPIVAGDEDDGWVDMVNVCTADGLHNVTLLTERGLHDPEAADRGLQDPDADADADPDADPDADDSEPRRLLRVWYAGPQRLRTYDTLNVDAAAGARVELQVTHG
jgi:hypothetical protein